MTCGNPSFSAASTCALENKLRPADYLEKLGAGQELKLKKVCELTMPGDGKPFVVYVVLYARLNGKTEQRWKDAELFKSGDTGDPFLRAITISSPKDLELLLDWHVEGCVLKRPGPPARMSRSSEPLPGLLARPSVVLAPSVPN